jgi:hypothetical protein
MMIDLYNHYISTQFMKYNVDNELKNITINYHIKLIIHMIKTIIIIKLITKMMYYHSKVIA